MRGALIVGTVGTINQIVEVRLSKRWKDNLRSETLQSEKIRGLLSNRNEPELDREFDQVSSGVSAEGLHHFILVRLCRAG